ncbi:glucan 1,3-beta-glucosidase GLUC78 precursor [Hypoxylon trugodes]|uniref:glucan 1,3-beta-glucosidase GLUC78 precursor n=1 Tax=Hypoxylon trugodes TaxID=326681 RepID=UPI00219D4DB1|nr:glucan 1,3-beta-glucosidase GLUC78 precursor [Hypoxylon trugodes]KAI1393821.1 glucan 1,3-beta-glucosidase GLUC78 precursor [Hypoxylon trugodes]
MGLSKFLTASILALRLFSGLAEAAQSPGVQLDVHLDAQQDAGSNYWVSNIKRQGVAAFGDSNLKIFRNVKDYGAKGDGTTDDTDAINKAVQDGPGRCIEHCDSRTTAPALVYFPPGVYMVSKPIIQTYYTQFVGDANDIPTLKAMASFDGMAVIDANPYNYSTGIVPPPDPPPNWYVNQNNFFRQVRNFIIDVSEAAPDKGTGIHWQVAQATSLQNIVFEMSRDTSSKNQHKGLYIENGSGGFMADLTFNGGGIGADFGSQQYTTRNLTFNNCNTAIHLNWNWVWLMHGVTINGGKVGIDMTGSDMTNIQVGSLLLIDSKISNVEVGISTLYNTELLVTNNTLVLDNVDMTEAVPVAIKYAKDNSTILEGNQKIVGFAQGRQYTGTSGKAVQTAKESIHKPDVLLDGAGKIYTRVKPQYETISSTKFVSVKTAGAKGDGKTDDTEAIQKVLDNAKEGDIVYFDHGAYIISDTVKIPKNIKITGEMWPLLMATGKKFTDASKPVPVLQVGEAGDVGSVEMSDLVIETKGSLPGAILMQWNLAGSENGAAGMWDVHFRIGGSAGTELQSDKCSKNENVTTTANPECMGAFMMLHLTTTASAYIENCWFWVADHELDLEDHNQINIFNGRGVLVESQKPVWLWGTASEHSILYNYQFSNAQNVFIGVAQSETAYFQGNPPAPDGAMVLDGFYDPDFSQSCDGSSNTCARTWGLRITNSSDIYVYGTGLYSFFDNYGQKCVNENNCQDNMISIEESDQVHLFGISTKASVNMITVDGRSVALDKDNRNSFCAAIAKFEVDVGSGSQPGSNSTGPGSYTTSATGSASASASETGSSGTVITYPTSSVGSGSDSGSGSASASASGSGSGSGPSSSGSYGVTETQATPTQTPTPTGSYVQLGGGSSTETQPAAPETTLPIPSETPGGEEDAVTVTITATVTAAGACSQTP